MFKIKIIYDENIDNKYVPEDVGIMCINRGKNIGCSLDNKKIEDCINPFVTNLVFQYIGLFWIIKSNKNYMLIFKSTVLIGYLTAHGITLQQA